jgi:hypothetical protein
VIGSNPVPESNRNKIINATGICIARKNCSEYLRTFAPQYPKGIFMINVKTVSKRIFILEQNYKIKLRKKYMMNNIQKPPPSEGAGGGRL